MAWKQWPRLCKARRDRTVTGGPCEPPRSGGEALKSAMAPCETGRSLPTAQRVHETLEPTVHLRLYGPASLQQSGHAPAALKRKQAALLAYLHHEGPTPRALLAGLLWPEAPNEGARSNLRQCIARLRRLSPGLLSDAGGLLAIASSVIALPAEGGGSPLLSSFDYADCDELGRWLEAKRENGRVEQRDGLMAAIRDATQRGDLERAQMLADALLGLDRESEESYRALMELAYLRGDFSAALAILGRCSRMLKQLYGVGPSASTRELGDTVLAAARQGELRPAVAGSSAGIPLSVLRPPRLIARGDQLDAMLAGWRTGLSVCVCGEAGIGKSRLLAEFAAALGRSLTVSARPGDDDRPYASLTRLVVAAVERYRPLIGSEQQTLIARLLPACGPLLHAATSQQMAPLQTERERSLALAALRDLLADCAHRGCAAFVFDDLHFADRATIEALPTLVLQDASIEADAPAKAAAPRFALGSRLDDVVAPSTRLVEAITSSREVVRIDLLPLADDEIEELVASLMLPGHDTAELSRQLRTQVGGNPAFLLEMLKLLLSTRPTSSDAGQLKIPPGIEAVIERRISLLGAPARHIAQLAAIAGKSYDLAMAAAALAYPVFALTEPLRELELKQVLHGRQFVHDLVASAAKRSIPAVVAEFMQRFVAEYLETHDGDPAAIAGHWRACSQWVRAGDCHVRAAAARAAAMRPLEHAECLDAAIECYEKASAEEPLFRAIAMRLQIVEVADRTMVRARLLERLGALACTEEQSLHVLLHGLSFRSDHAQAESLKGLREGLRRARAIGERTLEFEFVEPLAQGLSSHGRFQEAINLLASVEPWAATQADARLQGRVQRTLAVAHTHCDHLALAIEYGDRAIAVFRSVGDDLNLLPTMSNVGIARLWRGELDEARNILEAATRLRDRLHGGLAPNVLDINLACVLRDLGEFALADERFTAIAAATRKALQKSTDEPATDLALTENHHAQMWLMLGMSHRALAVMQVDDSSVDARFRARRVALRMRAARICGQDISELEAMAAALLPEVESAFHRSLFEMEVLRSAMPLQAADGFKRLWAERAVIERPGLRLHAAVRVAAALLACGDTAGALGWIEAAEPAIDGVVPFDMAHEEPWLIAAEVFAASGKNVASASARQHADAIIVRQTYRLPAAWRSY